MTNSKNTMNVAYVWGLSRIALGLIFLWAFFDKLWGLGNTTCLDQKTSAVHRFCDAAWVHGGSPTSGFLSHAAKGPFANIYHNLAGNTLVDWLFMLGLLGIGLSLLLGIYMRLATILGSVLLALMYLAVLPPANNPVIDDHIVYILILCGLWLTNDRQKLGFGKKWSKTNLVKNHPILR